MRPFSGLRRGLIVCTESSRQDGSGVVLEVLRFGPFGSKHNTVPSMVTRTEKQSKAKQSNPKETNPNQSPVLLWALPASSVPWGPMCHRAPLCHKLGTPRSQSCWAGGVAAGFAHSLKADSAARSQRNRAAMHTHVLRFISHLVRINCFNKFSS